MLVRLLLPWGSRALVLLCAAGVLVRVVYAVAFPVWEAPDERCHYGYLEHLAEHGEIPVKEAADYWVPALGGEDPVRAQFGKPPLAYLVYLPAYAAGRTLGLDDPSLLIALRLLSALLSVVLVVLAWRVGAEVDQRLAPACAAFAALCPSVVYATAVLNTTLVTAVLCSLALLLMVRALGQKRLTALQAAELGLSVGLAQYALDSSLLMVGALVAFVVLLAWGGAPRETLRLALLALAIAVLAPVPWYWRNLVTYGSLLSVVGQAPAWESGSPDLLPMAARSLWQGTFASFGQFNELNSPWSVPVVRADKANVVWGLLTALAVAGWVRLRDLRPQLVLCALVVGLYVLAALAFALRYTTPPGRYLFPVLPALALLLTVGLQPWFGRGLAPALVGVLAAADLYFLLRLVLPYYG